MKWLMTYLGNAINMENIVSVVWIPIRGGDEENFKNEILNSNTNGIVYATDVNNNRIILGEFTSDDFAQEEVIKIVEWLYNQEDNEPFHVLCDEDRAMANEIMEE